MWFQVNPRSAEPMYLQLVEAVKSAVATGLLAAGERLPSVRELATEMMINHNTIAKAYQELERERVIEVVRGRGTFVSVAPVATNREERLRAMQEQIRRLLVEAHHLQLSDDEIGQLWADTVRTWQRQTGGEASDGSRANTSADEAVRFEHSDRQRHP